MTNPNDIAAELERLAEKATPGPWTHENQFTDEMADFIYGVGKGAVVCQQSDADLKYSVANWPHCAALIVAYRNHHVEIIAALRAAGEVGERPKQLLAWAIEMFGSVADDRNERAMRFIEEAVELAQSCGLSRETIAAITERAYSRRAGTVDRELAQAGMTLEALAANIGFNLSGLIGDEFNRVREVPKEEWARRHAAKTELGITADARRALGSAKE